MPCCLGEGEEGVGEARLLLLLRQERALHALTAKALANAESRLQGCQWELERVSSYRNWGGMRGTWVNSMEKGCMCGAAWICSIGKCRTDQCIMGNLGG